MANGASGSAKRSGSRGSAKGDKSKSPGRSASKADTGKKSVTGKENRGRCPHHMCKK